MPKHGFVIGWVIAWFLIGYWKYFIESKVNIWWSVAFFVFGLFFGTVIQTLWDKKERKRKELEETKTNGSIHNSGHRI